MDTICVLGFPFTCRHLLPRSRRNRFFRQILREYRLKFHIVLSTEKRPRALAADSGQASADCRKSLENEQKIYISKILFVPDHVHLAMEIQSSVSPAELVVALMNSGQDLMWQQFSNDVICASVRRLY